MIVVDSSFEVIETLSICFILATSEQLWCSKSLTSFGQETLPQGTWKEMVWGWDGEN